MQFLKLRTPRYLDSFPPNSLQVLLIKRAWTIQRTGSSANHNFNHGKAFQNSRNKNSKHITTANNYQNV